MENTKLIPIRNVSEQLEALGLKKGDTVMIHSAFSTIRDIENGAAGFIQACEDVITDSGTIVMPVFNWDILHQGDEIVYDVKNTRSKMGFLTEYFRTLPGTRITHNLFNPLAVRGGELSRYVDCPSHTSWGDDSPFKKLYEDNALVLMVGVDYNSVTMFHRAEDMAKVPYRFEYHFPNAFWVDENDVKSELKNSTLRRYDGYPTDFNKAGKLFEEKGMIKSTEISDAFCRSVRSRELVDEIISRIQEDEQFLILKTQAREFVKTRASHVFDSKRFIYDLWLKNRALVSEGYDQSLEHIQKFIDLDISKHPTGTLAWDWTIPEQWDNHGGEIRSESGELIFDLGAHPLHIAAGSVPFKGRLKKEALLAHIVTDPERPAAIPYHTLYYDNDWKICLAHETLDRLDAEYFDIDICCTKKPGDLKIGQFTLEGQSQETILIPLHLDHPGQCNDNLSGIAAAIELIKTIQKSNVRFKYTIKIVFLPETIGIMTYLSHNEDGLSRFKWGLVFDSIGSGDDLMFMTSFNGDTNIDRCVRLAFQKSKLPFSEHEFLTVKGYGNDERALQVPGVDIPAVSISRYPYRQYHSSEDNPDIISAQRIRETASLVLKALKYLNEDRIPVKNFKGIPQLSKIPALKTLFSSNPKNKQAIHKYLFLMDGTRTISQIAQATDSEFEFASRFFTILAQHEKVRFLS